MRTFRAHSRSRLLERLSQVDISVSSRKEGRTTEETERWTICRLFATLGWERKLEYPLRAEKSERPDYVLSISGSPAIGIEVSEVVNTDLVRAMMLPEAQETDSIVDASLFRWRDQPKALEELREIASRKKLSGPGWDGLQPEREFADAISDRVGSKTDKLNEDTYTRLGEDWLLLYENLSLPALDLPIATSYLGLSLGNYWGPNSFNRVFVESGPQIVEFSQSRITMYEICNLW